MPSITSTITSNQKFVLWGKGGADLPTELATVVVAGGSNIADKNLVTPMGVVTFVKSEDLEWLQRDKVFQRMVKNGYLTITESAPHAPEKIVADGMQVADASAPLTPSDFQGGKSKLKVTSGLRDTDKD